MLYWSNPGGISREVRRSQLDAIARLNEMKLADFGDPDIATRIAQYEMAYRMPAGPSGLIFPMSRPPRWSSGAANSDARRSFKATHLLGIDRERLTYQFQGRSFRLTDLYGQVVRGIMA